MNLMFWRSDREAALRRQLRETTVKLGKANATINQHEATIRALNNAVQDWQDQLAEAEATIEGLGLENAALRRQIVDADNTAARQVSS